MKNARGLTASFFRSRASYFHRACLFSRRKATTALLSFSLILASLLSDHSVFLEFTCYILSKSPFEFFLRGEGWLRREGQGFQRMCCVAAGRMGRSLPKKTASNAGYSFYWAIWFPSWLLYIAFIISLLYSTSQLKCHAVGWQCENLIWRKAKDVQFLLTTAV